MAKSRTLRYSLSAGIRETAVSRIVRTSFSTKLRDVIAALNTPPRIPLFACETHPSFQASSAAISGSPGAAMPQMPARICAPIHSQNGLRYRPLSGGKIPFFRFRIAISSADQPHGMRPTQDSAMSSGVTAYPFSENASRNASSYVVSSLYVFGSRRYVRTSPNVSAMLAEE